MSGLSAITLPRGLFDADGAQHRYAVLRPITGHLEAQLAALPELGAAAVTELLASAVESIGGYAQITSLHTAALTRGDRHHALLHLRRGLFGDALHLVVRCPNPSCRQEADVDLSIAELAPEPVQAAPEVLHAETPAGAVTIREATGADDAAIAGLVGAEASAQLWSRLVVDVDGAGPVEPEQWAAFDAATRHAVALALADGAVRPSLSFAAPCPECAAWMEVWLDPAALLARELGSAEDRLFAEVHTLAFFYNWGEDAILALPRNRRRRYLELLRRQVDGRPLLGMTR